MEIKRKQEEEARKKREEEEKRIQVRDRNFQISFKCSFFLIMAFSIVIT